MLHSSALLVRLQGHPREDVRRGPPKCTNRFINTYIYIFSMPEACLPNVVSTYFCIPLSLGILCISLYHYHCYCYGINKILSRLCSAPLKHPYPLPYRCLIDKTLSKGNAKKATTFEHLKIDHPFLFFRL